MHVPETVGWRTLPGHAGKLTTLYLGSGPSGQGMDTRRRKGKRGEGKREKEGRE